MFEKATEDGMVEKVGLVIRHGIITRWRVKIDPNERLKRIIEK
jgi:hypothetical protein